jgi:translation initiation factor 2 subunit 1
LLKVLGEKVGWSEDDLSEQTNDLIEAFGSLYASFEEAAMQEGSLQNAGFEGEWIPAFVEIAVENIIPPFVEVRGALTLSINVIDGVSVIRGALQAAEALSNEEEEIDVKCFYDGAPMYRIELRAPDFKVAESIWEQATGAVLEHMKTAGGEATATRE